MFPSRTVSPGDALILLKQRLSLASKLKQDLRKALGKQLNGINVKDSQ